MRRATSLTPNASLAAVGNQFSSSQPPWAPSYHSQIFTTSPESLHSMNPAVTNQYGGYSIPVGASQRPMQQPSYPSQPANIGTQPQGYATRQVPIPSSVEYTHAHGSSFNSYQQQSDISPAGQLMPAPSALDHIPVTQQYMDSQMRNGTRAQDRMDTDVRDMVHDTTQLTLDDQQIPRNFGHTTQRTAVPSTLYSDNTFVSRQEPHLPQTQIYYPTSNGNTYIFAGSIIEGSPTFQARLPANAAHTQSSSTYGYHPPTSKPSRSSDPSQNSSRSNESQDTTVSALSCPVCHREISRAKDENHRQSNLSRHIRVQHGTGDRILCSELGCGRYFKRSDALRKHQRKLHGAQ